MLGSLTVALVALPLSAADIPIKPIYFQTIPYDVLTDAYGTPWFRNAAGIHNAKGELVCRQPEGQWLLADRAGRFWFATGQDQYTQKPVVWYYEEGKRVETNVHTRGGVWEDTAGRVFAYDGRAVHVRADGNWMTHTNMMPKEVRGNGEAQFVEDPKGRVWVWLRVGDDLSGVWAFDGKVWTRHDIPGAADTDRVRLVLPFADDWFLVVGQSHDANTATRRRAFAWSPSRTAEQIAKAEPFAGLPLTELEYRGTDLDGVRYFRWLDRRNPDMPHWQIAPNYPPYLMVSPAGKVTTLTREQAARVGGQPWDYRSATGSRRMFTKFDTPPVVVPFDPTHAVGRDKDGRIYIYTGSTAHGTHRVWVLWPEKERPGDVLRTTEYPAAQPTAYRERETYDGLFADAHGYAFARPLYIPDAIVAWDGKAGKWAGTPIKPLPQATWMARPAPPPEHEWGNFRWVGHTAGPDGRTVFVRVKTRYAPEKAGERTWGQFRKPGGPADDDEGKDDGKPFYLYEAWTHKDGAWSDSHTPDELLKAKRKELIAGLTVPHTPLGPLPVLSDGTRLWYAFDWKVHAVDADGTVHTADLPKPETKEADSPRLKFAPPFLLVAFAKLDDRSLLLAVAGPTTQTYRVTFRPAKPTGVRVEELAPLPLPFAVLHKAPDATLLAWADNHARALPLPHDGRSPEKADYRAVYQLTDGKWVANDKITPPVGVAPDGTLWCPPYQPHDDPDAKLGKPVLYRVSGAKAERFAWPEGEWQIGFEKPPAGATLVVLPPAGLGCIEPTKDGAKPTLRLRYTSAQIQLDPRRPAVTASGHLLLPTAWGRLFDPK
jgi:hypothetical protein